MAQDIQVRLADGERATIRLHSLDEYEADGGIYWDMEDGPIGLDPNEEIEPGEDEGQIASDAQLARNAAQARAQFVCAASCPDHSGAEASAIFDDAGITDHPGGAWLDSATGYMLLRDWPADAPLAVRVNLGAH